MTFTTGRSYASTLLDDMFSAKDEEACFTCGLMCFKERDDICAM